jgi:uncharacterized OB-fold protein
VRVSAQPTLYETDHEGQPPLKGGRCRACGYVFFPAQSYGCEACGAAPDHLAPSLIAGRGVLRSFATVHQQGGRGVGTPFTVGVIVLDDGPAVRALLTCPTDEGLSIGDRVRSVLVPQGTDANGNEIVELRFEKAGDA